MGWPQIAYIVLTGLALGFALAMHGKPRTGTHSFGWQVVGTAVGVFIVYAGGFFGQVPF